MSVQHVQKNYEKQPLLGTESTFRPFGLFWNIVKSFAGAGTFALPWAVMNAGLWTGVIGIVIVAVFSTYTINTLLACGRRAMERESAIRGLVAPPSYPEIGRAAMGHLGAALVSLFSGLMCFGVCIAYFVLIGGNISDLITKLSAAEIIWIVVPICMFLSCLTDLKVLALTSVGGSVALVVAMVSVIAYGFKNVGLRPASDYPAIDITHLPLFMGNAAFLFCDHVVVLPLAKSCGNYYRFPRILTYAVTFVTIINVTFAGLSYGFWGKDTCGNVISNLPDHDTVGYIVRVGISLEVLASFPLVSNAGFQSLETAFLFLRRVKAFPDLQPNEPLPSLFSGNPWYYLFRCGIIALLALLASTIKSFGSFVSLVGSLTIMATGFVFPQLFYLKLFQGELSLPDILAQYAIIVFGVGMTILGSYQAMDALIAALHHKSGNC